MLVVYYIAMKLSWLDLDPMDIFIAGVSSLFATLAVAHVTSGLLG